MKIEEIKDLMSHMKSTGLTNFEYEGQGIKVKMGIDQGQVVSVAPSLPVADQAPATISGEAVKSPIVGVFYGAPGPDKPNFVRVGDKVKKGDVLCIVEAMKVMNEIVAEKDCVILKGLCENEDVVEYGQPLFEIEAL